MNNVKLVEINMDNLDEVCALSKTLTPEQAECVAPNVYSVAQAHFCGDLAWFRAIYLDDKPIGFVMIDYDEDDELYDVIAKPFNDEKEVLPYVGLWRFMIARDFQNKGYGKQALDIITDKCRNEGKKLMYTSCVMAEVSPYKFYMKYGFKDTGVMHDGEEILVLKL